ncbi:MAG: hypothetical protein IIX70_01790, partial [Oscillospiraceae bacterium]|nr:hypothetical protein [Oscillospiraceae bacterium]
MAKTENKKDRLWAPFRKEEWIRAGSCKVNRFGMDGVILSRRLFFLLLFQFSFLNLFQDSEFSDKGKFLCSSVNNIDDSEHGKHE